MKTQGVRNSRSASTPTSTSTEIPRTAGTMICSKPPSGRVEMGCVLFTSPPRWSTTVEVQRRRRHRSCRKNRPTPWRPGSQAPGSRPHTRRATPSGFRGARSMRGSDRHPRRAFAIKQGAERSRDGRPGDQDHQQENGLGRSGKFRKVRHCCAPRAETESAMSKRSRSRRGSVVTGALKRASENKAEFSRRRWRDHARWQPRWPPTPHSPPAR